MASATIIRHLRPVARRTLRQFSIPPVGSPPVHIARRALSVGGDLSGSTRRQDNDESKAFPAAMFLEPSINPEMPIRSVETLLFDVLSENDKVSVGKFLEVLIRTGLRSTDPRLRETMANFTLLKKKHKHNESIESIQLDAETFKECIHDNVVLIGRALRNHFIVPEFRQFTGKVDAMYWNSRTNNHGKVADYIPQLGRVSPDYWGVSLCTIDGQRHSIGDTDVPFTIQSASKPLSYSLALQDLGADIVHQYIGQEPSGRSFNELSLNSNNRPHNPMINSGAIAVVSLLKSGLKLPDRFDYIHRQYKRMAGGEFVGFSNATFLSERESADRNFALAYYMKENKCFPEGSNLSETMDLYFQLCSCEISCESGAVIASTLANGGICPITGDRIFDADEVRNTLSLMHSCGMYDYSGQFAFRVGLPGKSGVSGNILLVIPNVMGMCLWSPPLDSLGNSVRGLQFIQELVQTYNFHNYDSLEHSAAKIDPRRRRDENKAHEIVSLLFSAYNGDVTAIRRYAAAGMDMTQADYDGRTALHLASAEGHLEVVKFLVEKCHVDINARDRWGFTPCDDAIKFDYQEVQVYLESKAENLQDDSSQSSPQQPEKTVQNDPIS